MKEADLSRVLEVLEPFAHFAESLHPEMQDEWPIARRLVRGQPEYLITVGDVRAALDFVCDVIEEKIR